MNKWNIQSEKDLFNELVDWASTYYSVILKDGQERVVRTYVDECADGGINTYYEYTDDDSGVDFDDILLWRPIEKHDYKRMVEKFKAAVDSKTKEELTGLFEELEGPMSGDLENAAQKYADHITAELYKHYDKHYNKEKKCMVSVLYNVNWNEICLAMQKCFMTGSNWKEQQLIEKACEWLKANIIRWVWKNDYNTVSISNTLYEKFRKAMIEE